MDNLITFANQLLQFEQRTHEGHDYWIAPCVAIVEGVLNGELVLVDEFAHHYPSWNNRPVVLDHPTDALGFPISANDPEILDAVQVGKVFNTRVEGNRLIVDVWLDVAKANLLDEGRALLDRITAGETIEVSTAYFRDIEEKEGEYNGEEYYIIQHNITPDHLAILLHDEGACSIADGCGFPRVNVRSAARTPKYAGTTKGPWSAPSLSQYLSAYPGDKPETKKVADLPKAVKTWIANHTLLGDANADNFRDLSFFPVVTTTGKLSERALLAVIGGRGSQANIPPAAKESAQRKARRLLNKEFDRDLEVEAAMNKAKIIELFTNLAKEFGIKINGKECCMEKIQAILESGLLKFNKEQLEEMDQDQIDSLYKLVQNSQEDPEKTPVTPSSRIVRKNDLDDEEEDEEDEVPNDPESQPKAVDVKGELDKAFEKIGGLDGLVTVVGDLQANTNSKKDELVAKLVENQQCQLTEEQLKAMDVATLEGIEKSLVRPEYPNQFVMHTDDDDELVELTMPSVIDGGGE